LPFAVAAAPAEAKKQQQQNSNIRSHCQNSKKEPQEPDAVEPELAEFKGLLPEFEELDHPWRKPEFDEASDAEPEDAEESNPAKVVVTGVTVGQEEPRIALEPTAYCLVNFSTKITLSP
jgi:hypothetical protein